MKCVFTRNAFVVGTALKFIPAPLLHSRLLKEKTLLQYEQDLNDLKEDEFYSSLYSVISLVNTFDPSRLSLSFSKWIQTHNDDFYLTIEQILLRAQFNLLEEPFVTLTKEYELLYQLKSVDEFKERFKKWKLRVELDGESDAHKILLGDTITLLSHARDWKECLCGTLLFTYPLTTIENIKVLLDGVDNYFELKAVDQVLISFLTGEYYKCLKYASNVSPWLGYVLAQHFYSNGWLPMDGVKIRNWFKREYEAICKHSGVASNRKEALMLNVEFEVNPVVELIKGRNVDMNVNKIVVDYCNGGDMARKLSAMNLDQQNETLGLMVLIAQFERANYFQENVTELWNEIISKFSLQYSSIYRELVKRNPNLPIPPVLQLVLLK